MADAPDPSAHGARWASIAAAGALIALTWWLLLPTLSSVVHQPGSDDGYYLRYMTELGARGLGVLPEQFQWYLSDRRHWIFPPPSRVGFSLVSAAWSQFFGASLMSLSKLSLAAHLALIALTFAFARRHLGELKALLIAALTAFAPLYLSLSRLALTDSFITLCQVACLWLFLEVLRAPRAWLWRIAFGLAFTFVIVTKEISVLLALPFATLAAIERFVIKRELPLAVFAGLLAAPPLAAVLVWIAAAGGTRVLYETMHIVLLSPATNEYAIQFGSGGWYRYPIDELLVSAWPTLLGLAGVAISLWRWRAGHYDQLRVFLALVYVYQVGVLSFFTKNLRYIAVLEVPLRALGVLVLVDFASRQRVAAARAMVVLAVVLLCWNDWRSFELLFLEKLIYDPVTFALSAARGLIFVGDGR